MLQIEEPQIYLSGIAGIDLGTTNSLIALWRLDDEQPEVVASMPSVVAIDGDEITVGQQAFDSASAIHSIKRQLGKTRNSNRHLVSPEQISAHILNALCVRAEAIAGDPIEKVVITVPAYFDDVQRSAVRQSAQIAGLTVLLLISEPTAAALAYRVPNDKPANYAVFDLGGGTFDFSLLEISDNRYQVLAIGGDDQLGGDDIDRALAEYCGYSGERLDSEQIASLRESKHGLFDSKSVNVQVGQLSAEISQQEFTELCEPFVKRMLRVCKRTLLDAKLSTSDLSRVLLVGGSTRLTAVRSSLAEWVGESQVDTSLDPDQVVALGAAIQAAQICGYVELTLVDVTPLSIGVETQGGIVEVVIPRNTPIPTVAEAQYTTAVDNQTAVKLHVVQGERALAEDCRTLAQLSLPVQLAPAGRPRISLQFIVDENSVLHFSARESDNLINIDVDNDKLSADEIVDMQQQAEAFREQDRQKLAWANAITAANAWLTVADKALLSAENSPEPKQDLRQDLEPLPIHQIMHARQQVEQAISNHEPEQLLHCTTELQQLLEKWAADEMNAGVQDTFVGVNIDDIEI